MKGNEIFSEGLSNYMDTLRQDAVAFFNDKWNECTKTRKNGKWTFEKIYNQTGMKNREIHKDVTIRVHIWAQRGGWNTTSFCKKVRIIWKDNQLIYEFYIYLNLSIEIDSRGGGYDELLQTLEHEITHVSQHMNKTPAIEHSYISDTKTGRWVRQIKQHYDRPHEKEAAMVALFYSIKNETVEKAIEYYIANQAYWKETGFDYKDFLKKAADYGISSKLISNFILAIKQKYPEGNFELLGIERMREAGWSY